MQYSVYMQMEEHVQTRADIPVNKEHSCCQMRELHCSVGFSLPLRIDIAQFALYFHTKLSWFYSPIQATSCYSKARNTRLESNLISDGHLEQLLQRLGKNITSTKTTNLDLSNLIEDEMTPLRYM
jgi:hypothetical protein